MTLRAASTRSTNCSCQLSAADQNVRRAPEQHAMKSVFRPRWLSIFAITALTFAGIRLAAGWLLPGAHERLVQQYWETVRKLPEGKAARFVAHLAENDAEWAEVLIAATADDRPLVASTAERELRGLVLR